MKHDDKVKVLGNVKNKQCGPTIDQLEAGLAALTLERAPETNEGAP